MSDPIITLQTERIEIRRMSSGEWELQFVLEDGGDDVYHYVEQPDLIYEQLTEQGLLSQ